VIRLWLLIGLVVIGLIAVVPRKRSWGPITYSRRSMVGGPVSGRVLEGVLFAALVVLVVVAIMH
jgi:uncharacterized membrane protein